MVCALFVSFFTMFSLRSHSFSFLTSTEAVALACILPFAYPLVLGGTARYALVFQYRRSFREYQLDCINSECVKILKLLQWYHLSRSTVVSRSEDKMYAVSFPWWKIASFLEDKSCRNDEDFTKRFCWLASGFRSLRVVALRVHPGLLSGWSGKLTKGSSLWSTCRGSNYVHSAYGVATFRRSNPQQHPCVLSEIQQSCYYSTLSILHYGS